MSAQDTAAQVRATAAESARQTRGVLDAISDPGLEGAALAFDAISRG